MPNDVKIQEKRQVAIAIQSVSGTAESLDAGDVVLVLAKDTNYKPNIGHHDRGLLQASLSQHAELVGVEAGTIQTAVEVKGSGSLASDQPPDFDVFVRICGFARRLLRKISIGAVASGPFQHGETVTGGSSGATGRVVGRTANGTALLEFVWLSGTFQSGEVLTGGTSGASATSSSVSSDGGFVYEPISSGVPVATLGYYHDGIKKGLRDVRGNLVFRGGNARPGEFMLTLTGIYVAPTDTALLAGVTYEETLPPVLKGAAPAFANYEPQITNVEIDVGNVVALRESMAAAAGAIEARITGRRPTSRFDPELDSVANFDFYGQLKGGSTFYAELSWGSTAGNRFKLICPEVQILDVSEGDRNGISVAQCMTKLCGGFDWQDGEFVLVAH